MKKILFGVAALGLLGLAGAGLGLKAQDTVEAKADDDTRKVFVSAVDEVKNDCTLAVWLGGSWVNLSETEEVNETIYYTFNLPTNLSTINFVRAENTKSGATWGGDGVTIYNQTANVSVNGFNLFSLTGYDDGSNVTFSSSILENIVSGPTKRIFLDRGGHWQGDGQVYAFYTQGYFFKPTGYVQVSDGIYYAYFDIPLSVLLATGKTYSFKIYSGTFATYEASTNEATLSWDSGKLFRHVAGNEGYQTIERVNGYDAISSTHRYDSFNVILKDINPCDNASAYKDYIGCGALADLESTWHLNPTDSHGLGLSALSLNNDGPYNSNANGETVLDKLVMMEKNSGGSSAFSVAEASKTSNTAFVGIAIAATVGFGISLGFIARKRRAE